MPKKLKDSIRRIFSVLLASAMLMSSAAQFGGTSVFAEDHMEETTVPETPETENETTPEVPETQEEQELLCGIEEHAHAEDCYALLLVCKETDPEHVHEDACFERSDILICEETEHEHTDECYHEHEEEETKEEAKEEEKTLYCEKEEHTHDLDCIVKEFTEEYICENEDPEHEHTGDCYFSYYVLTCDLEEHVHEDFCYTEEAKKKAEEEKDLVKEELPVRGEEGEGEVLLSAPQLTKRTLALTKNGAGLKAAPVQQEPVTADGITIEKITMRWLSASTNSTESAKFDDLVLEPTSDIFPNQQWQLDLALSGKGNIEAGDVEIAIPAYIWKDRNGNEPGLLTLAIPEEPSTANEFAWKRVDDMIIITNTRPLSAGSKYMVQGTFRNTSPDPNAHRDFTSTYAHDMVDIDTTDDNAEYKGISDWLYGTVTIITPRTQEEISMTSNSIRTTINTSVQASAATKKAVETPYFSLPSSMPSSLAPANQDDYVYLKWYIDGQATGNQPFTMVSSDTLSPVAKKVSEHGEEETVAVHGIILGSESNYQGVTTTGSTTELYDGFTEVAKSAYVWTAFPKSDFLEEGATYTVTNSHTVTVTGYDDGVVTTKSASADVSFRMPITYTIKKVWEYNEDKYPDSTLAEIMSRRPATAPVWIVDLEDNTSRYYGNPKNMHEEALSDANSWETQWTDSGKIARYKAYEYSSTVTDTPHGPNATGPSIVDGDVGERVYLPNGTSYQKRWWYDHRATTYDEETHTWTFYNDYHEGIVWSFPMTFRKTTLNHTDPDIFATSDKDLKLLDDGGETSVIRYRVNMVDAILPLTSSNIETDDDYFNAANLKQNYVDVVITDYEEVFGSTVLQEEDYYIADMTPVTNAIQDWNPTSDSTGNWVDGDSVPMELYGLVEGEWIHYGTYQDGVLTPLNGATKALDRLILEPNTVKQVKAEIRTNGGMIAAAYDIGVVLNPTEKIQNRVASLFNINDYALMTTTNYVKFEVFKDGESVPYHLNVRSSSAYLHGRNYRTAVDLDKESTYVENDRDGRYLRFNNKVTLTEQTNIPYTSDFHYAVENDMITDSESGTFYDLLPPGMQVDTATIRLDRGTIKTIDIKENYKDSGRQLLVVKADLSGTYRYKQRSNYGNTSNKKNDDTYPEDGFARDHVLTFDMIMSYDEAKNRGFSDLRNHAAYEANEEVFGDVKYWTAEKDAPSGNNHKESVAAVAENAIGLMTDLDPNRDDPSFVYASDTANMTEVDFSALTDLRKFVQTQGSDKWSFGHENDVNVYEGGKYNYKIQLTSGMDTTTKDIIILDSLENYVLKPGDDDYIDGVNEWMWKGYFRSIDVSEIRAMGVDPVIYYYTGQSVNIDGYNTAHDYTSVPSILEGGNGWSTTLPADPSTVTAFAIDCRKTTDGSDFELQENEALIAYVHMRAPVYDEQPDAFAETGYDNHLNNAHAYNNVFMDVTQVDEFGIATHSYDHFDYTKVGIMSFDMKVEKRWEDMNDNDRIRPDNITVNLYANGVATGRSIQLTAANGWTGKLEHVRLYDDNDERIQYSINETPVTGYTSSSQVIGDKLIVTNMHDPEKIDIPFTKTWTGDEEGWEANIPSSITVRLFRSVNGSMSVFTGYSQKVTPDKDGNWSGVFKDMLKYRDGVVIDYMIQELPVKDFDATIDQKTKAITNRYYPYSDIVFTKKVTNGTASALENYFDFTLSLTTAEGTAETGQYEYVITESDITVDSGKIGNGGEFRLKHDQTITVLNLPTGTSYQITESPKAGFSVVRLQNTTGTIVSEKDAEATITNRYAANGSTAINGTKTLTGREMARAQFHFSIYNADGGRLRTASNTSAGDISFGNISFTARDDRKLFSYTIREDDRGRSGYTYDDTEYLLYVVPFDNGNGTMTVKKWLLVQDGTAVADDNTDTEWWLEETPMPKKDGYSLVGEDDLAVISFENEYHADGEVNLKAYKQLPQRNLTAGEFTFDLMDENGTIIQTKTNAADGSITFDPIEFDENAVGKTQYFFVAERKGTDPTVEYDENRYAYAVEVTDNGDGTLNCVVGTIGANEMYVDCDECHGTGATFPTAPCQHQSAMTYLSLPTIQEFGMELTKAQFEAGGVHESYENPADLLLQQNNSLGSMGTINMLYDSDPDTYGNMHAQVEYLKTNGSWLNSTSVYASNDPNKSSSQWDDEFAAVNEAEHYAIGVVIRANQGALYIANLCEQCNGTGVTKVTAVQCDNCSGTGTVETTTVTETSCTKCNGHGTLYSVVQFPIWYDDFEVTYNGTVYSIPADKNKITSAYASNAVYSDPAMWDTQSQNRTVTVSSLSSTLQQFEDLAMNGQMLFDLDSNQMDYMMGDQVQVTPSTYLDVMNSNINWNTANAALVLEAYNRASATGSAIAVDMTYNSQQNKFDVIGCYQSGWGGSAKALKYDLSSIKDLPANASFTGSNTIVNTSRYKQRTADITEEQKQLFDPDTQENMQSYSCDTCNGSGTMEIEQTISSECALCHGTGTVSAASVDCEHCEGTGKVRNPELWTFTEGRWVYTPTATESVMPIFTNNLKDGSLSITKLTENAASADPNQEFNFKVKLIGAGFSGQVTKPAVLDPAPAQPIETITFENGEASFSLKAGDTLTISELPAGTAYQVYEQTPDEWLLVKQENVSGATEPLETAEAKFTNRYQPGMTSAQFSGTKTLDNRAAAKDSFSFELYEVNAGLETLIETAKVLDGGFIQFPVIQYEQADVGTHIYHIREVDPQDEDIDYDSHTETVTVLVEDDGLGNLSTEVTYDSDGIVFSNRTRPGTLEIKKNTDIKTDANKNDEFTFKITLKNPNGMPLSGNDTVYYYRKDAEGNIIQNVSPTRKMMNNVVNFFSNIFTGKDAVDTYGNEAEIKTEEETEEPVKVPEGNETSSILDGLKDAIFGTKAEAEGETEVFHATPEMLEGEYAGAVMTADGDMIFFRYNDSSRWPYDSSTKMYTVTDVKGNTYTGLVALDVESINFDSTHLYASESSAPVRTVSVAPDQAIKPKSLSFWFSVLKSLKSVDLSRFDTSETTSFRSAFDNCSSLESLDLSMLDTSNVIDYTRVFENCTALEELDISGWTLSGSVKSVAYMTSGCTRLTEGGFDAPGGFYLGTPYAVMNNGTLTFVRSLEGKTGDNITSVTDIKGNVWTGDWIKNVSYMEQDWTTTSSSPGQTAWTAENKITVADDQKILIFDVNDSFLYSFIAPEVDLRNMNVKLHKNFNNMFSASDASNPTTANARIDISTWDMSSATSMKNMFYGCSNLTTKNLLIPDWHTENVTDMNSMFYGCAGLTELDLSNMNTDNVNDMRSMFYGCYNLEDLNISGFTFESITPDRNAGSMFSGCTKLDALDLSIFPSRLLNSSTSGPTWNYYGEKQNQHSEYGTTVYGYTKRIILPEGCIARGVFSGTQLKYTADKLPGDCSFISGNYWRHTESGAVYEISNTSSATLPAGEYTWVEVGVYFDGNGGVTTATPLPVNGEMYEGTMAISMPDRNTTRRPGYILLGWSPLSETAQYLYTQGQTYNIIQNPDSASTFGEYFYDRSTGTSKYLLGRSSRYDTINRKYFPGSLIKSKVILYAQWEYDGNNAVIVNHYQETEAGGDYVLAESEEIRELPGTTINTSIKNYSGFHTLNISEAVVVPELNDDVLIINYYYDRDRYTVSFDGNGETSGQMLMVMNCAGGIQYTLPKNVYQKTGSIFLGWSTEKGETAQTTGWFTTRAYAAPVTLNDGDSFTNLGGHGDNIVLYAQWAENADVVQPTEGVIYVTVKAGETIVIQDLPYGTTYTIEEVNNPAGWETGTITGETGTIDANTTDQAAVSNTYHAEGEAVIVAHKALEGDTVQPGQFSFSLLSSTSVLLQTKTNGEMDTMEEIAGDDDAVTNPWYGTSEVRFDSIRYTESDIGKTYTYLIKEVAGAGTDRMTYDTHTETVTVRVSDAGGGILETTVTYDSTGPLFTNSMKTGELKIQKHIENATDAAAEQAFNFTIKLTDANGNPLEGEYPVQIRHKDYHQNIVQVEETRYSHTNNISDAGVRTGGFGVNQRLKNVVTIPGATTLHVVMKYGTYNSTSSSYGVVYVIPGEFTGEINSSNANYGQTIRVYGYSSRNNSPYTRSLDIDGDTVTFGFYSGGSTLNNSAGAAYGYGYYAVITATTESIEESGYTTTAVTNGGSIAMKGNETAIVSGLPHGATYEIVEQPKSGWDLLSSENETGTIEAGETDEASFTNIYSTSGMVQFEAAKEMIGGELEADTFKFELTDSVGNVIGTAYADAEGKVTFPSITYDASDNGKTYLYAIREITGNDERIIYDDHTARIQVAVNDNGLGEMVPTISYDEGALDFTNILAYDIEVSKQVEGGPDDMSRQFEFTLTLTGDHVDAADISYEKGSETGKATIEDGVYAFTLAHGETIRFSGIPAGLEYKIAETRANQDSYETSLITNGEVVENPLTQGVSAEGTLSEDVTAEFTNKRNVELTVRKTVSGNMGDKHRKFTFYISQGDQGVTSGQKSFYPFEPSLYCLAKLNGKVYKVAGDNSGLIKEVTGYDAYIDRFPTIDEIFSNPVDYGPRGDRFEEIMGDIPLEVASYAPIYSAKYDDTDLPEAFMTELNNGALYYHQPTGETYAASDISNVSEDTDMGSVSFDFARDTRTVIELAHGETYSIVVPYDTPLTVEEKNYADIGYTTIINGTERRTVSVDMTEDRTLDFVNQKEVAVPTRITPFSVIFPIMIFVQALGIIVAFMWLRRWKKREEEKAA